MCSHRTASILCVCLHVWSVCVSCCFKHTLHWNVRRKSYVPSAYTLLAFQLCCRTCFVNVCESKQLDQELSVERHGFSVIHFSALVTALSIRRFSSFLTHSSEFISIFCWIRRTTIHNQPCKMTKVMEFLIRSTNIQF